MKVRVILLALVALQLAAAAAPDDRPFDLHPVGKTAPPALLSAEPKCAPAPVAGEILVCGSTRDDKRYRLPLPDERVAVETRHSGDTPNGMAALTPVAPCGIFAGQRRCSKAEAAQFGYGNGRDPITLVVGVVGKIVDPDSN